MTKVFISYSRKDKAYAEKLNKALKEINLESWIDWDDIPPTADWWDQIQRGIETADAFIFLLSPNSVTSKVCGQEIDHAVKNGKRLIPLVVHDVNADDVHVALSKLNWIYFREQDDFTASLKKLEMGIKTDLVWVEIHTRLQVRAVEWERRKDSSLLLRGQDLREAEERLASTGQKDPKPTDLQRQYVLESRKSEGRTRNLLMGIGIAVLVALAFLALFAFNQRNLATNASLTAIANQNAALTSEAVAVNEANSRATAQANEEVQRKFAEQQSNIAIARQLAIQAQAVSKSGDDRDTQTVALLLATQSLKLFPSVDASNIIRSFTFADQLPSNSFNGFISSVAFSPDGKYIVAGGCDQTGECNWGASILGGGKAVVIETSTGKEVSSMTHDDNVNVVTFSLDGKYVISGGDDGTARVWEADTGKEVSRRTYETGHVVTGVAFSPVRKYAASGSSDGKLYIWEYLTGKLIFQTTLESYTGISVIAFSPDGKYLAIGGSDGVAYVLDLQLTQEVSRATHEYGVTSLAFSPEGKYVISGGGDNTALIWNVSDGQQIARLVHSGNQGSNQITSAAFSPDENYVLTASTDGTARVWSFNAGISNEVSQMTHTFGVYSAAFSPDGKYVISGGYDGIARVWEAETGKEVAHMTHGGYVLSVAFSPDGNYVVSGGCDQLQDAKCIKAEVRVWRVKAGPDSPYLSHDGEVFFAALSPDINLLLTGGYDNTVRIWDFNSLKEVTRVPFPDYLTELALSPDGKYFASGNNEIVQVWDIHGKEIKQFAGDKNISTITYSSDGKYLAFGDVNGGVTVYDTSNWEIVARLQPSSLTTPLQFSPDGKYIATGGCDNTVDPNCLKRGTVTVWNVQDGDKVSRMSHENSVDIMEFNKEGNLLISGGCDTGDVYKCNGGSARVWDVLTGKEISRQNYLGNVTSLSFSPDDKLAAAGGCNLGSQGDFITCDSSSIYIWDAVTGDPVSHMAFAGGVRTLGFSPDGRYIVSSDSTGIVHVFEVSSGVEVAQNSHLYDVKVSFFTPNGDQIISTGGDGRIKIWSWRPDELIAYACSHVTRNLTTEEWDRYVKNAIPYADVCSNKP